MVLYPFYLLKMRVTNNFETTRDYNTRQTSSILPVCARTTLYNNYFLASTVRSWNNEPMATKNSRCPSSLQSYYKSKCIKKPIYYYSGTQITPVSYMYFFP